MFSSNLGKLIISITSTLSLVMAITINQFCNMPCCKEIIETNCCDSSEMPQNIDSPLKIASDANHCTAIDKQLANSKNTCNHLKNRVLDKKVSSKNIADIALIQNFTKEYFPILLDKNKLKPYNLNLFHSFLSRSNTPLIC
tara:strand:- start:332 stop:754 length:423 start_codon:yes stop_codon:yes gene_type:complete